MPDNFTLAIDSLMHAAYRADDEIRSEASRPPSVLAPCNSQESNEEIEIRFSPENEELVNSVLCEESESGQAAAIRL